MSPAYQEKVNGFLRRHRIGQPRKPMTATRSYAAGRIDRLTADWNLVTSTGDSEIRYDIVSLRDRARELERNNVYVSRWLNATINNVLKERVGYSLQMRATRPPDFRMMDDVANQKIEFAWGEWCRKRYCTETGEDSFYDVVALALRSRARDGGMLIKPVFDKSNPFGMTLRLIEIDYLDVNYTTILSNGNRVIMGVEKDPLGRTVNYHLLTRHPGDLLFGSITRHRYAVPANELIHYFVKERITQCVGVPSLAPAMLRLKHLSEYELAELIASRAAANKGGYFQSDRGDSYAGEPEMTTNPDGTTQQTGTIADSEPGTADELPPGMKFVEYDPQHPTQQYGTFTRDSLMGISAGMNISYATLTGDLSNANYSSMRAGSLEEREGYKKMQAHQIEHLCLEIFERWLASAITSGAINLPMSKFDQFNRPMFRGRRWSWVDPEKDITAATMEIDAGLSTRTKWTEESGEDFEDICQQLDDENKLAESHGLKFVTPQTKLILASEAKIGVDPQNLGP